jgi:hypothetical protein
MALGWKVLLPLSLALIFIAAAGILLQQEFGGIYFYAGVPLASILAGFIAIGMVDRTLRRKEHARA